MRILVCGGRDCYQGTVRHWLETALRPEIASRLGYHAFSVDVLIHGGARGADEAAARWGESEGAGICAFPANWKKHGKAAGPIRNRQMIVEGKPDVVIAFPGGRGTASMVRLAHEHGVPVIEAR